FRADDPCNTVIRAWDAQYQGPLAVPVLAERLPQRLERIGAEAARLPALLDPRQLRLLLLTEIRHLGRRQLFQRDGSGRRDRRIAAAGHGQGEYYTTKRVSAHASTSEARENRAFTPVSRASEVPSDACAMRHV